MSIERNDIEYSIIIPTFNRVLMVEQAINTALSFCIEATVGCEIIIIDDNSTDNTSEVILKKYTNEITSGLVKLIVQNKNGGVVLARNIGVKSSSGKWLIFLDSDNELLPNAFKAIDNFAKEKPNAPCLCLRAENQDGLLMGEKLMAEKITLDRLLNKKTGELFGVYNRDVYIDVFFDPLIERLRRFEAIGVFRALIKYGDFELSNSVVRLYHTDNDDRLCNSSNIRSQSCLMAKGHFFLLKEFWYFMSFKRFINGVMAMSYYLINCLYLKLRT